MSSDPARPVSPKRWRTLSLAGTATGIAVVAATGPALAADPAKIAKVPAETLWLTQSEGGEGGEAGDGGEGGEGGERGAPADASPDAAYLIELGKLEAHLTGAMRLHGWGLTDDAAALAAHPEAEFMDGLRDRFRDRGARDLSPEVDALVEALAVRDGEQAAYDAATDAIRSAEAAGEIGLRPRYDAVFALMKDAASEYSASLEGGRVSDPVALAEAQGFLASAAALVALADDGDRAAKMLALIEEARGALPESPEADVLGDPSVLHGAAARVEILALGVK